MKLLYCLQCQKGLIYLGRENATISPQSKLSEYDAELLRHNPTNTEALFHLGMVYKSRTKRLGHSGELTTLNRTLADPDMKAQVEILLNQLQ